MFIQLRKFTKTETSLEGKPSLLVVMMAAFATIEKSIFSAVFIHLYVRENSLWQKLPGKVGGFYAKEDLAAGVFYPRSGLFLHSCESYNDHCYQSIKKLKSKCTFRKKAYDPPTYSIILYRCCRRLA